QDTSAFSWRGPCSEARRAYTGAGGTKCLLYRGRDEPRAVFDARGPVLASRETWGFLQRDPPSPRLSFRTAGPGTSAIRFLFQSLFCNAEPCPRTLPQLVRATRRIRKFQK